MDGKQWLFYRLPFRIGLSFHLGVEFYHRINLSGVKDNMTNGMGLYAFGLPPTLMLNDAHAQLDTAAL
jgi:hypothetical protein